MDEPSLGPSAFLDQYGVKCGGPAKHEVAEKEQPRPNPPSLVRSLEASTSMVHPWQSVLQAKFALLLLVLAQSMVLYDGVAILLNNL